jgi:Arc-like DNA binding domain
LPRKPADIAHVNLRIREHLRRKLEAEAKRHQVSLNSEVMQRLEASFEDKARNDFTTIAQDISLRMTDLDQLTREMEIAWARFGASQELIALGNLMAEKIIDHGERFEWVQDLARLATEWRRQRAVAEQRLREMRLGRENN